MKQDSDINYEKGLSFLKGDGVENDPKTALFYLRKSASQGNIVACHLIVFAYTYGMFYDLDIDHEEAMKFGRYGHDHGDFACTFAMAELIEKILTVEKNERHDNPEITSENMLKFYHKAAEAGLPSAQISLGNLYSEGHLVERNTDLADYWYQLATAKKDNSKALEAYTNFLIEEDQFDKAKEYAELGTKIDETKFMHLLLKISMAKKDSKTLYTGQSF